MEGQAGDGKGKDVALDERRRDKGPGVDEGELRHEVEVRDHDLRVRRPLAIANGRTQDRLDAQGDEHDARHGRDIYSGRHGGQSAWSGTRSQLFGVAVASRPICWWPVMEVGPGLCSVPRCLPQASSSSVCLRPQTQLGRSHCTDQSSRDPKPWRACWEPGCFHPAFENSTIQSCEMKDPSARRGISTPPSRDDQYQRTGGRAAPFSWLQCISSRSAPTRSVAQCSNLEVERREKEPSRGPWPVASPSLDRVTPTVPHHLSCPPLISALAMGTVDSS